MQDPAVSILNLITGNYSAGVTDPLKASVSFFNSYFDPSGKIRTYQISVLGGVEPHRNIVMGSQPKYEVLPDTMIHVWVTVLPGKTLAATLTTRRNLLDEIVRVLRAFTGTDLSFTARAITINNADELGQVEPKETRRLHSIMRVQSIYFKPTVPVSTAGTWDDLGTLWDSFTWN